MTRPFSLAVAVLRRAALKPGGTVGGINHTKVTEVYYVVSGEGTLVTGGEVKDIKPLAATSELVTTIVGPRNNATFVRPADSRKVKTGDVIIIPPGVYHGFSEVIDHIEYVTVRPDLEKVLPAGYINPALKKSLRNRTTERTPQATSSRTSADSRLKGWHRNRPSAR